MPPGRRFLGGFLMRLALSVLVGAVLLLSGHSRAEDELPAGDLALMQGRWKAWIAPDQFLQIEVRGKTFTLVQTTGDKTGDPWSGVFVIDAGANPKRLTWKSVQLAGRDLPENQCIYELHGDTWLLIGGGASAAPDRFYSGGGKGSQTLVFKREAQK